MTGYEGEAFKHHKPITHDAIASRLIKGKDGGFRARAVQEGYVGNEATVGVVVQMLSSGKIEGVRMAKFGKVAPKDINSADVWPERRWPRSSFPSLTCRISGTSMPVCRLRTCSSTSRSCRSTVTVRRRGGRA